MNVYIVVGELTILETNNMNNETEIIGVYSSEDAAIAHKSWLDNQIDTYDEVRIDMYEVRSAFNV